MKQGGLFAPISREGALVFNNLFLTTACLTVFVGTLYPLALEAFTGEKISVGAPFFNLTFGPLFMALMIAMPFGPLLAWKRGDLLGVAQRLMTAFAVGLIAIAAAFAIKGGSPVLAPFGVGLAFYVMAGAVIDLVERTGLCACRWRPCACARPACRARPGARRWRISASRCRCSASSARPPGAPSASSRSSPAQTVSLSGYDLSFDGMCEQQPARITARRWRSSRCARAACVIGVMEPSKRSFSARETSTNEAALMTRGVGQLYLSLGDTNADGSIAIRLYYKPLVLLIWLGAVVMMLGGALSLSDRRLRVGAPKPAAQGRAAAGGVGRDAPLRIDRFAARARCAGAALAVRAGRNAERPGARGARAASLGRAALHGLPEPVDRRFGGAARPRPAAAGARAADQGRQRPARCSIFWWRATASSCCSSRASNCTTLLLWGLPPVALLAGMIALFMTARRRQTREFAGAGAQRRPNSSGLRLWSSLTPTELCLIY